MYVLTDTQTGRQQTDGQTCRQQKYVDNGDGCIDREADRHTDSRCLYIQKLSTINYVFTVYS